MLLFLILMGDKEEEIYIWVIIVSTEGKIIAKYSFDVFEEAQQACIALNNIKENRGYHNWLRIDLITTKDPNFMNVVEKVLPGMIKTRNRELDNLKKREADLIVKNIKSSSETNSDNTT